MAKDNSPNHILAASGVADERTRVLKHGDTFAVFDHYGDIKPGGLGEEGLYHEGTRFLSCLVLELEGGRPFLLKNYATAPVKTAISLHFAADFADIFEVRGMKRKAHGQHLAPEVADD